MPITINRERLAATFTELCEIDSPSLKEAKIAQKLKKIFTELGADTVYEDTSAAKTGAESGNLIIRFNGNMPEQKGLFFSCHMDTVGPAAGVEVVRTGDIFTSKGDTILGGDDKSGIAAVVELLTLINEHQIQHPMIEVVITTCEEIGLLGAKHLDFDKITTQYGYALDSTGINNVIIGAPAGNKLTVTIKGLAAHAGLCPEAGINALSLCASAINKLQLGRLDEESTCNFGIVKGGVASNIIPETVVLEGEVRSHSPEKLISYTRDIVHIFEQTIDEWQGSGHTGGTRPTVSFNIVDDYPPLLLKESEPVIQRIHNAAKIAQQDLEFIIAGGGSDANIFCGHGLPTAIIATGMDRVHTLEERLDLNDLVTLTELLYALLVAADAPV